MRKFLMNILLDFEIVDYVNNVDVELSGWNEFGMFVYWYKDWW